MPVSVFADGDVAAMLETLPTVEQFQAMDADAQLEAYNQVQAAYDAYANYYNRNHMPKGTAMKYF
jgi:hypothetical protein